MRRPLLLPALGLAAVLATAMTPPEGFTETTEHLYIHNAAADCVDRGRQFLVYEQPTEGSNCGYIYGLPLNEVEHRTDAGLFEPREYTTRSGFEITLDASRDLTGTVVVTSRESVCASPTPAPCVPAGVGTGVGEVVVDIVATGRGPAGTVSLGSASPSTVVAPGTTTFELPFTIDLPDSVDRRQLTRVTLSINARGVHVHSGYVNASGLSFLEVPSLTPIEDPAGA